MAQRSRTGGRLLLAQERVQQLASRMPDRCRRFRTNGTCSS